MLAIDLTGRRALVTGGARGIGAGVVRAFVACGARVVFSYQGSQQGEVAARALAAEVGPENVRGYVARVEDAGEMDALLARAAEWLGGVDIVVANAGLQIVRPSLGEVQDDDWRRTFAVNVAGTFYTVRSALPFLKRNARSSIILIGSSAAYTGSGGANYAASKAALEGLLRAMLKELTPHGVRCNMIHPCVVDTEMFRQRYSTPELRAGVAQGVPLGRLSTPEDVAYLAAFLCSGLGEFIVGQSILVDGGRTFGK